MSTSTKPWTGRPVMPRTVFYLLLVTFLITVWRTTLSRPHGVESFYSRGQKILGMHACSGWKARDSQKGEFPDCLRARQWEEFEAFLKDESVIYHMSPLAQIHNREVATKIKLCLMGVISCPERPLLVSGYFYMAEAASKKGSTTGEVIWMHSFIEQVETADYLILTCNNYHQLTLLTKLIPSLIHLVMMSGEGVVSCLNDPRCIAPEFYIGPEAALEGVTEEEQGVIQGWGLFAVDYWGSRPPSIYGTTHYWGIKDEDPWSFNPLGSAWTLVPFDYPGHTHISVSIEPICTKQPLKPHSERNDSILIYAKKTSYFYRDTAPPLSTWSNLTSPPLSLTLLTTSAVDNDGYKPIPEGLEPLGPQSREQYEELVGGVRVLLGVGTPRFSPSVYSALCQGTPVVLPYFKDTPTPTGWDLFSDKTGQHGPAALWGEPYVYSYKLGDQEDLVEKLQKARNTPIDRFIPPEMTWKTVLKQTENFLNKDWQAEYERILYLNGGNMPRLREGMMERCDELHRCAKIEPPTSLAKRI